VPSRFYDVAVLGTELAPLTCAALLAKRGFRVLVLGQGVERPDYEVGALRLPRRPFTLPCASSPIVAHIVSELGLGPGLRRPTTTRHGALQVALPNHRFDLHGDEAMLEPEIERELPEVKRPILELHRRLLSLASASDELFERLRAWPPRTLLERRNLAQLAARLDLDAERAADRALAELAERHPFRLAVRALCTFASNAEPDAMPELALARQWRARLIDTVAFGGGQAELADLLAEKVQRHSGEVLPRERAASIVVRRGAAVGVRIASSEEEIGCTTVIAGVDVGGLPRLLEDRAPLEELFERLGEPQPRAYRYTLNLVTSARAIPEGMGRDVLFVRTPEDGAHGDGMLQVQRSTLGDGRSMLCVETTLPAAVVEKRDGTLADVRERVLAAVSELLPFVGRHLQLVDSPHDGRKPFALTPDTEVATDALEGRGPHTMTPIHGYPVNTALALCAMPVRTPLRGLLLCNSQVAPSLGIEGELLAARSAALTAQSADRGREWLRRRLWTKVDL
jgi:hypothetical protein